jgi:hypothetical protein
MTTAETGIVPVETRRVRLPAWGRAAAFVVLDVAIAYMLLLAVHAYLGHWTPDYLQGRSLWHFWLSRMIVPMAMLGVFASFARIVPSGLMLAAALLLVGTISAIKREATGEPFQVSDLFLAGQSVHLLHYVTWYHWLMGSAVVPAAGMFFTRLRIRWWSLPAALLFAGLLSSYRIEAVSTWIHDNSWWIGVENLTFSQAESERMNGLGTHLYFSTAGLRLKTYTQAEVMQALDALHAPPPAAQPAAGPSPDLYIVLGEAWWRDPFDPASPLNQLEAAGFTETSAVSPVYGGTTPNAEFEVLTAVPVKSFQAGIIPYQHYVQYVTDAARALPRLLAEKGYATTAYHNFTRRFWLRDKMYPLLGFERFISMDEMQLAMQPNDWPTDEGLYQSVLANSDGEGPRFHFIVTVQTHGPYEKHDGDADGHAGVDDYRARLDGAAKSLAAFKAALDARARPYALVVFGDHLPGLRLHQWTSGMKQETDPRLHQVPVLVASNAIDAQALAKQAAGRPLYCLSPLILRWIGQPVADRYMNHAAETCAASDTPMLTPSEAVIQNQLFSKQPL